jgi:hypothetical protein
MAYGKSIAEIIEPLQKEYSWFIALKTDAYYGDARAAIILAMMKDFE